MSDPLGGFVQRCPDPDCEWAGVPKHFHPDDQDEYRVEDRWLDDTAEYMSRGGDQDA